VDLRIDEGNLKITKSLAAALKHIRSEDDIATLWVDQVSINQQDFPERNSQVKLMGQIYTKAASLVIWIGEEAENAPPRQPPGEFEQWLRTEQEAVYESRLKDFINQVAKVYEKRRKNGDTRDRFEIERVGFEKYGLPPLGDPGYSALLRLLQQRYFSRGWIVQELALPRGRRSVFCGTTRVPLQSFCYAVAMCMTLRYTDENHVQLDNLQRFLGLMKMREAVDEGKSRDLLKLILHNRTTVTTDPRDKIYCLLGLSSDQGLLNIEPNYEDSVENVYRNFTLRHIEAYGNLDVLTVPRSEEHSNLPSWTADWRLRGSRYIEPLDGRNADQICQYRATKETQASITASSDPNVIGLSGYSMDTVMECGRRENSVDKFNERTMFRTGINVRLGLIEWKRVARLHTRGRYITGETKEDAFIRCMTAGYVFEPNTNFDVIRENYRAWTRFLFLYPTLLWIFPVFALPAVFWLTGVLRAYWIYFTTNLLLAPL
jgi:hypothetical protein